MVSDTSNGRVLECSGLRKSYGDIAAVKGVGFHIAHGECYGLLGPNGAGKTTTISMVCGLLKRDAGEVTIDGNRLDISTTTAKGAIGYVPQEVAIYPDLTARENLSFFGQLYGMGGRELAERIDEILAVTGLGERANDRTDKYSGGMKRRLNIGIALLHRPRLLVLDEPTVGVDPQSRNAILGSVEHLSDDGMAVLYTTHYMEEAERLCDRVGIIDEGEIRAEGTRRELVDLLGQKDNVILTGTGNLHAAVQAIEALDEVEGATSRENEIHLIVAGASTRLPQILTAAASAEASITGVEIEEPDLETVFLRLTGKALRD